MAPPVKSLHRSLFHPKKKIGREVRHLENLWFSPGTDHAPMELSVPRLKFDTPYVWDETGSSTILAEGTTLEDGSLVLAKLAKVGSAGGVVVEREMLLLSRLGQSLEAGARTMRVVDFFVIPPGKGDVVVLILKHPGHNYLPELFPATDRERFLCYADPTPGEGKLSSEEMSMMPKQNSHPISPSEAGTATPNAHAVNEWQKQGLASGLPRRDSRDSNGSRETRESMPRTEGETEDEDYGHTEIDIASFLEFAIQASHCVEILHVQNITHREIRPNAFHWNTSSAAVRWAHLGNRSVSLEGGGGASNIVVEAESLGESERKMAKDALCYVVPEQTGRVQFSADHRTDLYQLGVTFYTILSGSVPFQGSSVEIFEAIVTETPKKLHEIRPDVPRVVSRIVSKLLEKDPDDRYRSAPGLKADLVQCQQALQVLDVNGRPSSELIPSFPIAANDKFSEFTLPNMLCGRTDEVTKIKSILRRVESTHSSHYSGGRRTILSSSSSGQQTQAGTVLTPRTPVTDSSRSSLGSFDSKAASERSRTAARSDVRSESESVELEAHSAERPPQSPSTGTKPVSKTPHEQVISEEREKKKQGSSNQTNSSRADGTTSTGSFGHPQDHGNTKERLASARAIIVSGARGVGKTSLVLECQTAMRTAGFYGLAKFDANETSPYSAILSCLSAILRQLITQHSSDITTFYAALKKQLGPQLANTQLLTKAVPEIKQILTMFGTAPLPPVESLATQEGPARFHSIMLDLIMCLAEVRMTTVVLEDFHNAEPASISLIRSLAAAQVRMVIVAIHRPSEVFDAQVKDIFGTGPRATYIDLAPLPIEDVASIVSKTLHQPAANIMPFVSVLYRYSRGNPFSTRNLLVALKRHKNVYFDWQANMWKYNLQTIESEFFPDVSASTEEGDVEFLVSHLHDLAPDVQRFLLWASLFGGTFRIKDVVQLVDTDETFSSSSGSSDEDGVDGVDGVPEGEKLPLSRGSMNGLQTALAEGWIINKGRERAAFTHDRYRQAAANLGRTLPPEDVQKMALKIVALLLKKKKVDFFQVAEHVLRCIPLLQTMDNDEYQRILHQAGDLALSQGAHEMALRYFEACQQLAGDTWANDKGEQFDRIFDLRLCVAQLLTWRGDTAGSGAALAELLTHCTAPTHIAAVYRADSKNMWATADASSQLDLLLRGLGVLGVDISTDVARAESDTLFTKLHDRLVAQGVESVLHAPKCTDPVIILATSILAEASTAAFFAKGDGMHDMIGLTLVELALNHGMTPSSSLGFVWMAATASEVHDQFRFAIDIAKLAVKLADLHSSSLEIGQVHMLYSACTACFDGSPLRDNLARFETSFKYSITAGDRPYSCFSLLHLLATKLDVNVHLSDSLVFAEECVSKITEWSTSPGSSSFHPSFNPPIPEEATEPSATDFARQSHPGPIVLGRVSVFMLHGVAGCLKALAGQTVNESPETVHDDKDEAGFKEGTERTVDAVAMQWYNSFKVVSLYSLGWFQAAAELGFIGWDTKHRHPNHYHVRYGIHYHSLALIQCLREPQPEEIKIKYRKQIELNQAYIGRWLETGAINFRQWTTLVEAEVASLDGNLRASNRLYDLAIKYAREGEWASDEGWSSYLYGSHFVRSGVEGLGLELQQRGIQIHSRWGAFGIVNHLSEHIDGNAPESRPGRHLVEVGVQTTRTVMVTIQPSRRPAFVSTSTASDTGTGTGTAGQGGNNFGELVFEQLTFDDLAAVLRSSQNISTDVNLPATLESLTEIVLENSGAGVAHIVVKSDDGVYKVVTSLTVPGSTVVYENPIPVSDFSTDLFRSIVGHVLHSKETVLLTNALQDLRFSSHADPVAANNPKSVVCLPILSKGLVLGAIFLTSGRTNAFTASNAAVLSILAQQASISIANAQLFRKLQRATQTNIRMIEMQKKALEDARRSREDALLATKVKSNFLASMSHELRTPFSSFFGLLELLGETDLNREQRDFVQTAQASCALLLDIIDSLLDYSKLEAGAVKLEVIPFSPEEALADSLELLMVQASKKGLQLAYDVGPTVPLLISSDPSRLRQVLNNLLANALKFTSTGSVTARCSVDTTAEIKCKPGEVILLFEVSDTGIGMTPDEQKLLFRPFSQVDGSTTRHFGGTGLGLSICLQLVKLLGGHISVDSAVDQGSRFHFSIPVQAGPSQKSIKMDAEAAALRAQLVKPSPPSVLIVSSSHATISFVKSILRGANISVAPSVEAAKEALFLTPVGFVLLDFQDDHDLHEIKQATLKHKVRPALISLFVPTPETMKAVLVDASKKDIYRSNHPIRRRRLIQLLIDIRTGGTGKAVDDSAANDPAAANVNPTGPTAKGDKGPVKMIDRFTEDEKTYLKTARILIAEDNPVAARLLVKSLERLNLNVTATVNGEEAIDAWDAQPSEHFSLCLFDSHMPLRDGPSAAARIRELESKRGGSSRVPIVGLSADCQQSAKLLALSAGMSAWLNKPLRSGELVNLLRTYVLPRLAGTSVALVNGKSRGDEGTMAGSSYAPSEAATDYEPSEVAPPTPSEEREAPLA